NSSSSIINKSTPSTALVINNKFITWGYEVPKKPRFIDTIILHSSYNIGANPYSLNGVLLEFKKYGVSAHYIIDRDGNIYRLVPDKYIAYHAGVSKMPDGRVNVNPFSIGIEMIYKNTESPNDLQYNSLAKLVKYLESLYHIKYILGHYQIAPDRKTDPWNFSISKLRVLIDSLK
ncbi:MAG: N-acetylmuramoyl-L-alanine amidase, partial [Minisyncoccia bacterium]